MKWSGPMKHYLVSKIKTDLDEFSFLVEGTSLETGEKYFFSTTTPEDFEGLEGTTVKFSPKQVYDIPAWIKAHHDYRNTTNEEDITIQNAEVENYANTSSI